MPKKRAAVARRTVQAGKPIPAVAPSPTSSRDTAIAERIAERMKALGMTQSQVAEAAFGGKANQPYVSALLNGQRTLTRAALERFAQAFGCSEAELDPAYISIPPRRERSRPTVPLTDGLDPELVKGVNRTIVALEDQMGEQLDDERRMVLAVQLHNDFLGKEYSDDLLSKRLLKLAIG